MNWIHKYVSFYVILLGPFASEGFWVYFLKIVGSVDFFLQI